MEHGFGGMFMIRIMIVFVFIYVMFIGIALNIAKAYRIKNGVINILEQYQYDITSDNSDRISDYLDSIPYVVDSDSANNDCNIRSSSVEGHKAHKSDTGVCIIKIGSDSQYHYKVYVYMSVDFPFFGLDHLIPISGETVTMSKPA